MINLTHLIDTIQRILKKIPDDCVHEISIQTPQSAVINNFIG